MAVGAGRDEIAGGGFSHVSAFGVVASSANKAEACGGEVV